ncbi:hypothetical protein ONO12_26000, partial [Salmonella enterica subsp. enterica serovar Montevideo]|nr:hypothetical protein [Salmonella enterica subsp. enterica serovar Montevideo]
RPLRSASASLDVTFFSSSLASCLISAFFSSRLRKRACCGVSSNGDSLDSINATSSAIVKYVSQRAGIGINAGRIRALGSPIRGGE